MSYAANTIWSEIEVKESRMVTLSIPSAKIQEI